MASVAVNVPELKMPSITVKAKVAKRSTSASSESLLIGSAAGFLGGFCQTYVGQPFDTVKVRMQTATQSRGMMRTAGTTWRHEGIRGLYHGTTPALLVALIENTVAFGVNEQLKSLIKQHVQDEHGELPMAHVAGCGAVAGFVHCFFSNPVEVIKSRLQVTNSPYKGFSDCFHSTLRNEGLAGLYSGFLPLILRDVPFYLTFFASYEAICGLLQQRNASSGARPRRREDLSAMEIVTAGGLAGMIGWSGVQPFDTAAVRMQTGRGAGSESRSVVQTCKAIYRLGGWRGFFPGWVPAMVRAFPANAALFIGFEGSRRGFNNVLGN